MKKAVSLLLALSCLFCAAIPVSAQDPAPNQTDYAYATTTTDDIQLDVPIETNSGSTIIYYYNADDDNPYLKNVRMTYIKRVTADLSESGTCTATASIDSGYYGKLSMSIQRLEGSQWVSKASWSTTKKKATSFVLNEDYSMDRSYTYRVVSTMTVYKGSTSTVLETATAKSSQV